MCENKRCHFVVGVSLSIRFWSDFARACNLWMLAKWPCTIPQSVAALFLLWVSESCVWIYKLTREHCKWPIANGPVRVPTMNAWQWPRVITCLVTDTAHLYSIDTIPPAAEQSSTEDQPSKVPQSSTEDQPTKEPCAEQGTSAKPQNNISPSSSTNKYRMCLVPGCGKEILRPWNHIFRTRAHKDLSAEDKKIYQQLTNSVKVTRQKRRIRLKSYWGKRVKDLLSRSSPYILVIASLCPPSQLTLQYWWILGGRLHTSPCRSISN